MPVFEHLNLSQLSAVEQEIYRYIVNNLEKIPYMRVRDIANGAHVSSTSVFRFVQKVGYDSYPEFRFYIKAFLEEKNVAESERQLSLEQRIQALNMNIFHPDVEYQIKKMAKAVEKADLVLFMGLGASGAIAQYSARKLASLGYFAISLDELTYPIRSFLKENQKTVLIFFSISGETKELIEVILGIKNQASVEKYCITQNHKSTLAQLCDYSIEYAIKEERKEIYLDLSSQLPAIAILETLIGYLKTE
ncbi:DNA-binding MurR/RpiR family transcriptional regulator [Enterococcus sp. PF1-24]|uniref:MurR/RpiR family transcriptional regulator n=1 Tax=unclassified Enterococcus TaxID=2608891 RepID=UPI00247436EC|nr:MULTISPECIES: MurR/RpiR family transcriptional regulator [unclassified Enterococcus]MDH6364923.1 DNA-binding MurR/RpiR family transcriptional regulator [Enterococcus sp. PFB1-1]MDH6402024.1 DNA-binding MurR/RpiR family transcriptional regulator [Enterococcus sp. PF1-24]